MIDQMIDFFERHGERATSRAVIDTLAKYAHSLTEFDTVGRLYHKLKEYGLAIRYAEKALAICPDNGSMFACRANLAKLHNASNNGDKALFYLRQNLLMRPDDAETYLEMVFSLFLLNRKYEAEQFLLELNARSDLTESMRTRVEFNLGTYDLYHGRFQEGMRKFILTGKKLGITPQLALPLPQWTGGELPKRLIVCSEAGIGDEIINVRFYQHLIQRGVDVLWLTQRLDLARVFNRCGIRTYTNLDTLLTDNGTDFSWCYAMALPVYLNLLPDDLWRGPYLWPGDAALKMGTLNWVPNRLKVGLRWNGNPYYDHDLHRGLPLHQLHQAVNLPETALYSLQRDEGADEVLAYPDICDLSSELVTWDDTLGVIAHLDVVVTSCTSIAHASAAMGKRTIVLVPIAAYYTWASTHDTTSIWYGDNVTVLRQVDPHNWNAPMQQLGDLLKEEVTWRQFPPQDP